MGDAEVMARGGETEIQQPGNYGPDADPVETAEWLESLAFVLETKGPERAAYLLSLLEERAHLAGVELPFAANTPYINTIGTQQQPVYPGNREIERRIKSITRWNAMAMVVRANRELEGIGGHISTYASAATLLEVGFHHFFRGRGSGFNGDQIYFQGHASPGIYSRAFLEGRLTETHLRNFRRELQPESGLSSYPHPWLMPDFWEFPTVSMGLGPIMAIYQARFNKYLKDRGIKDTEAGRVWAFLGDGETDEPETLGAITLASRERLDNLIFVVNCNLQRLDGPVRGNGKIIQELEALFRGAGWNVIKVIWGSTWDPLLAADSRGLLMKRMAEVVDGQYQKYITMPGAYIREHFFGKYPELLELVRNYSDEQLERLARGGHDPAKVYAAYKAAVDCKDRPSVILAKTIKGYGLGESGEGRNVTHQQKKLNEEELREFRTRFGIPVSDDEVAKAPFYKPPDDSPEMIYLRTQRQAMGGCVPARATDCPTIDVPQIDEYPEFLAGSKGREVSTTMAFVRLLMKLTRDKQIGKYVVPIVPDESRTFGMEGMFRQIGIYAHTGQLYEPVDSDQLMYYREAKNGQILEEGITEAGSMASLVAAGTAYCQHGINMIPFFVYYSMFGFQRVGDLIWAAVDARAKGFMIGGTAGRTTLNGEGLQHQDGHSLLNAIAFPTVRAYDPAYAYETAVIVFDGLKRLYQLGETALYYITVENENYVMPPMPSGVEEGIIRGAYRLGSCEPPRGVQKHALHRDELGGGDSSRDTVPRVVQKHALHRDELGGGDSSRNAVPKVQLLGSGAILRSAAEAQQILAERYGVASDLWSVTSYHQLAREAQSCRRWNMLHPQQPPRVSYLEEAFQDAEGPVIAASDYVRAVPEQLGPFLSDGILALGTDGLGRSDSRSALRRHFEVDAHSIVVASLWRLCQQRQYPADQLAKAIDELGIDPDKPNPMTA